MKVVYFDHAATTPLREEVVAAMIPYLTEHFGNPSSIHRYGRRARHGVDEARTALANTIGADEHEIIFTSGGTEANNLAIIGYANEHKKRGRHVITTAIEHHAVLEAFKHLEMQGFSVTYLPVDENGRIQIEALEEALRDDTILVSVMYANNETGVLQPIHEIGQLLQDKEIAFHTDAVQAFGSLPLNVKEAHIDMLTASAHKINGPKGSGFLYVKKGIHVQRQSFGGEQERKRRAGTENVASIVAFAKAAELATSEIEKKTATYKKMKERLLQLLEIEGIHFAINGDSSFTLPHIVNVSFTHFRADALLAYLDLAGIAASSGSACTAGTLQPSHVLQAMFSDEERIQSAIRFSFGWGNELEDVDYTVAQLTKLAKR